MALIVDPNQFVATEQATSSAGGAVTLTVAAVPGKRHAITNILIMRAAGAAVTGRATLSITTTNLPDSMAWAVGNLMAAGGTQIDVNVSYNPPLISNVANTATTIVMPDADGAGTSVVWTGQVNYYLVPEL